MTIKQIIKILKNGSIGVMPTDTIYGLVGQALNPETVARIRELKQRRPDKPFIILISDFADLKTLGAKPNFSTLKIIKQLWPGSVSIVFSKTLSCRLPNQKWLCRILKQTGPLIATSVNPEGKPPAQTSAGAKKYFGKQVDFYFGQKRLISKPSSLIKIRNNQILVLRG